MRILVLGASGMLGHKVWQTMKARMPESWCTLRRVPEQDKLNLFPNGRVLTGYDLRDAANIARLFELVRPEVVVNCVGIVKQVSEAADPVTQIELNALLPHRLAGWCRRYESRLIHFSTDCVFSGEKGAYREEHIPDPHDLYGRAKALGEVTGPGTLTIRSSIIGRELGTHHGLLEWFLSQRGGRIKGFRKAIFSGLTTVELARLVIRLLTEWPDIEGLYHVASDPISKYDLLRKVRDIFGILVEIDPDSDTVCNRSLDGSRFNAATGYIAPSWDEMLQEIARDTTPYQM